MKREIVDLSLPQGAFTPSQIGFLINSNNKDPLFFEKKKKWLVLHVTLWFKLCNVYIMFELEHVYFNTTIYNYNTLIIFTIKLISTGTRFSGSLYDSHVADNHGQVPFAQLSSVNNTENRQLDAEENAVQRSNVLHRIPSERLKRKAALYVRNHHVLIAFAF